MIGENSSDKNSQLKGTLFQIPNQLEQLEEQQEFTDENEELIKQSLQKVLEYIERCRINGQGGLPDDDGQGSSWAKEQAAIKPTLLPELKFHDLVFGQ